MKDKEEIYKAILTTMKLAEGELVDVYSELLKESSTAKFKFMMINTIKDIFNMIGDIKTEQVNQGYIEEDAATEDDIKNLLISLNSNK